MNYIEHLLILVSTVTGCVSNSVFASLVGVPASIATSAVELKICVITAEIKKYKSIIKKKNKTVQFAKSELISIEVLISKALIWFK